MASHSPVPEGNVRFFRSTMRTADHRTFPSGTGLGLAIVDALVKANSGQLSLAGTPGGGLTVGVTLPRAPDPTEGATEPRAGTAEAGTRIEQS